ncbi:DUF2752 domain-containing protein [Streptomyces cinereoruber]|uniref:DUF2752 domain-containing protein n=1 Tax=Streptomyces cinereoruber TaxID=67260 RepID=UPI0036A645F6
MAVGPEVAVRREAAVRPEAAVGPEAAVHRNAAVGPEAAAVPPSPPGAPWPGSSVPSVPPAPPRSRARRLLAPVATLAGVVAAFAYVGAVDPNEPGHYPVCPLLRFTGVYCPGCGGLRSAHAFAHGDLPAALGANALAVVGYGVFAVVAVLWLVRAYRGVPMRLAVPPNWWWGIGAVLALFTLVRNLPFGSALAP